MNLEKEVPQIPGNPAVIADNKLKSAEDPKTRSPELSKIMIVNPEQIDAKLAKLKGVLPSLLLNRLAESLKMTRVTESQCDEIIMRTVDQFKNSGATNRDQMDVIFQKLESLDSSILSLVQFLDKMYGSTAAAPSLPAQPAEVPKNTNIVTPPKEQPKNSPIQEIPKTSQENEKPLIQKKEPPIDAPVVKDCPKNVSAAESHAEVKPQIVVEKQAVRLTQINSKIENEIVLLKWIEFLLERVGRENLPRTLEFYGNIMWINDEMMERILIYARGVNVSQPQSGFTKELSVKDHIQSLLFIEKLRGCEVDKQSIISLEKEIVAIKKSSEGIYGI